MRKVSLQEKEKYLLKFPQEERDKKRVKMAQNGFKTDTQLDLEKGRHISAIRFYRARAYSLINKEEYDDLEKYKKDLIKLAWANGYEAGYAEGRRGKLPKNTSVSDIYLSRAFNKNN